MRHKYNFLIHLLFWGSSHTPCSLQHPQKRNPLRSGQVGVVAIQCHLFFQTNAVERPMLWSALPTMWSCPILLKEKFMKVEFGLELWYYHFTKHFHLAFPECRTIRNSIKKCRLEGTLSWSLWLNKGFHQPNRHSCASII